MEKLIDTACWIVMVVLLCFGIYNCNIREKTTRSIEECVRTANKEMHQCIDEAVEQRKISGDLWEPSTTFSRQ